MSDPQVRDALPAYEVGEELGRGAMGEVLAGYHRKLDRHVAIKRLPTTFALVADVRERFAQEARVLASLSHPHVVPVYDYVEDEGLCLLVMQALGGGTVWDRFSSDGLSMAEACSIAIATCAGVHHAHEKRIVHRDIKPENLMFDSDRALKVTDFGIAAALSGDQTVATLDGTVIGTPAYMAPEQAEGSAAGVRSDVYAIGVMLYELLSGSLPFDESGGVVGLLRARVDGEPIQLGQVAPDVPPALVEVVMHAIERRPEDRYDTAQAFGIAVSHAATESWGTGWMARTGLRMMDGGAFATASVAESVGGTTSTTEDPVVSSVGGRATLPPAETTGHDRRDSGEHRGSGDRSAETVVRATRVTAVPVDLRSVDPREVVPVSELLETPPPPKASVLAGLGLVLLVCLVLVFGLAGASRGESVDGLRSVSIDGRPVAGGVDLDLGVTNDVEIVGAPPDAASVQLSMSALGVGPWSSDVAPLDSDGDVSTATLHTRAVRLVASGPVRGELTLRDVDGVEVASASFVVRSTRSAPSTVAGVGSAVVVAILLLSAFAVARPLRMGRDQRAARRGLVVTGAAIAMVSSVLVWSLGAPQPSWITLVVAAALGAGAGWYLGDAVFVAGRRRRLALLEVSD